MITREHGSWAILGVPLALGAFLGGEWSAELLLFVLSAVALFLATVPLRLLLGHTGASRPGQRRRARGWAAFYLALGIASALPLVLGNRPLLVLPGIAGAGFFGLRQLLARGHGTSLAGGLVAAAGLTLTAPASFYVATGETGPDAWRLWALCFGFFAGTLVHVQMKLEARGQECAPVAGGELLRRGAADLSTQALLLSSAAGIGATGLWPASAVLAYVPMAAQVIPGTLMPSRKTDFKRLGVLLLAQSVLFGAILASILR